MYTYYVYCVYVLKYNEEYIKSLNLIKTLIYTNNSLKLILYIRYTFTYILVYVMHIYVYIGQVYTDYLSIISIFICHHIHSLVQYIY